jgi:hypothetical protein
VSFPAIFSCFQSFSHIAHRSCGSKGRRPRTGKPRLSTGSTAKAWLDRRETELREARGKGLVGITLRYPYEGAERDVTNNMLHREYNNPKRVIAFNTAEKWSSDVSEVLPGKS